MIDSYQEKQVIIQGIQIIWRIKAEVEPLIEGKIEKESHSNLKMIPTISPQRKHTKSLCSSGHSKTHRSQLPTELMIMPSLISNFLLGTLYQLLGEIEERRIKWHSQRVETLLMRKTSS
jgi:hypothetical protein